MATGIQITPPSDITVGTTAIQNGTEGRVLFQGSGNVVQQDSELFWDNTNKRLGVGTSSPSYGLDVNTNARLNGISIETTGLNTRSIQQNLAGTLTIDHTGSNNNIQFQVNRGGTAFIPLFIAGSTGHIGIGASSANARLDVRAQGALSTDIAFRVRNSADTANFLVVNGAGDVYNNGAGGVTTNTFYGENVGRSASGNDNTLFGESSGRSITTGSDNTFFGRNTGFAITAQVNNTFIGSRAGQSTTTSFNTFIGSGSGTNNTTGSRSVLVGIDSGRVASDGTTPITRINDSVLIGSSSKPLSDNQTNQIVIGYNAIGTGSNSVTLGNTSITRTNLRGQIVISGFATAPTGVEGAIYYDTVLKKHYGFDGVNWNALY